MNLGKITDKTLKSYFFLNTSKKILTVETLNYIFSKGYKDLFAIFCFYQMIDIVVKNKTQQEKRKS